MNNSGLVLFHLFTFVEHEVGLQDVHVAYIFVDNKILDVLIGYDWIVVFVIVLWLDIFVGFGVV